MHYLHIFFVGGGGDLTKSMLCSDFTKAISEGDGWEVLYSFSDFHPQIFLVYKVAR